MRLVDFNALPRGSREQFVRALVTDAPSLAPMCRRVEKSKSSAPWVLVLLAGIASCAVLAALRFGSLSSPVQDRRYLGGYSAAFAAIGLGISMLARRRALRGILPFAPGIYVFPYEVVDARGRDLALYPLRDMQSFEAVEHEGRRGDYAHTTLWLAFAGGTFTFDVEDRDRAESVFHQVNRLRGGAGTQQVDPFADARARDFEPANDHGLLARDPPLWTRFVWAVTALSALVGGVGVYRLRNRVSDDRAIAPLRAHPTIFTAEAYLAGTGLKKAEIRTSILPQARLAEVKREVGPARAPALEKFLAENKGSSVEAEARALLAEALSADLATRKTIAELRAFLVRWPNAPDAAAVRARVQQLFAATRKDFAERANTSDKNVVPVVDALLRWTEEHAEPVPVVLRRREGTPSSIAVADRLLARDLLADTSAKGGSAPLAPLLEPGKIAEREVAIVRGLEAGFLSLFPAHPIALARGGERADAPLLSVDYEIAWAGTTFVTAAMRRYLGLRLVVDLALSVPKDTRVLSWSLRLDPPAVIPLGAHDDGTVYDTILLKVGGELGNKSRAVFFTTPRSLPSSSR